LKRLYYDTVSFSPHTLSMVRNMVGADHMVMGSDYPHSAVRSIVRVSSIEVLIPRGTKERTQSFQGRRLQRPSTKSTALFFRRSAVRIRKGTTAETIHLSDIRTRPTLGRLVQRDESIGPIYVSREFVLPLSTSFKESEVQGFGSTGSSTFAMGCDPFAPESGIGLSIKQSSIAGVLTQHPRGQITVDE
jgi:hypothetical protein